MKSKIRVEYDFDKKEPYIQLYLEKETEETPDLRDQMLKAFIDHACMSVDCDTKASLQIIYPPTNADNSSPQIRWVDESKAIGNPPQHVYQTALELIDEMYKRIDPYNNPGLMEAVANFRCYKPMPQ